VLNRALEMTAQEAPDRPGVLRRLAGSEKARKYGSAVLAVAVLVVLWGGYIQHWQWTGFPG
jgi:hypothetical protein